MPTLYHRFGPEKKRPLDDHPIKPKLPREPKMICASIYKSAALEVQRRIAEHPVATYFSKFEQQVIKKRVLRGLQDTRPA